MTDTARPRTRTTLIHNTRAAHMVRLAVLIDRGEVSGMMAGEIADLLGMSLATLKRHLAAAEHDLGLKIRYQRYGVASGSTGDYYVADWGVIDRNAARKRWSNKTRKPTPDT